MIGPLTYLDIGVLAIAGLIRPVGAIPRPDARTPGDPVVDHRRSRRPLLPPQPPQVRRGNRRADGLSAESSTGLYLAQGVVGILIFVIVLVLVHLITMRISDTILDSQIGMVDRILGFIFGLARGFVIVVIPYMLTEKF